MMCLSDHLNAWPGLAGWKKTFPSNKTSFWVLTPSQSICGQIFQLSVSVSHPLDLNTSHTSVHVPAALPITLVDLLCPHPGPGLDRHNPPEQELINGPILQYKVWIMIQGFIVALSCLWDMSGEEHLNGSSIQMIQSTYRVFLSTVKNYPFII